MHWFLLHLLRQATHPVDFFKLWQEAIEKVMIKS